MGLHEVDQGTCTPGANNLEHGVPRHNRWGPRRSVLEGLRVRTLSWFRRCTQYAPQVESHRTGAIMLAESTLKAVSKPP